ncbi:MAG: GH92 family glycosyl hydrolase, partial [Acidimicrobiales bacterium]
MAGKASLVGVVGLAMALATTPWAGASTPGRSTPAATPGHHGGPGHQAKPVADPASLVNPLIGTGSGGKVVGDVDTFPGADYPFGMLQWSPDTSPTRTDGGGYYYPDNHILGFSLTHISGPGCQVYGDVPILPTVGSIGTTPGSTTEPFTHAHEHASAGYYSVDLGQPAVKSQLTVTPRTGIGQFTFPATQHANFLVKAGDSANGSSAATAQIVGNDEVVGSVTSGHFCNAHHTYTVHYVLKFNRPFTSHGTWNGSSVTPGADQASGSKSGAWVTFDTTSNPVVLSKVAISFVSQANAQQNLQAEQPGWSFQGVRTKAKS